MVKPKEKGNAYEWEVARRLSLWLTGGASNTEFVRSVQSGGWAPGSTGEKAQPGDLAANGNYGRKFLEHFTIECKHHNLDPDFWHIFSSKNPMLLEWWLQAKEDAAAQQVIVRALSVYPPGHHVRPLLFVKRNRRPEVVVVDRSHCPIPEAACQSMQIEMQNSLKSDVNVQSYEVNIFKLEDLMDVEPTWIYENWT